MANGTAKLHALSFGLSLGILWAIGAFTIGVIAWQFGIGTDMVQVFGEYYVGYKATLSGSAIGALWAFADAFIGGFLIALLYNFFHKRFAS